MYTGSTSRRQIPLWIFLMQLQSGFGLSLTLVDVALEEGKWVTQNKSRLFNGALRGVIYHCRFKAIKCVHQPVKIVFHHKPTLAQFEDPLYMKPKGEQIDSKNLTAKC